MANTANSVMTPQAAVLGHANLAAVTACTTRGPTATAGLAAANIVVCVPTVSTDCKISRIDVKGISTSITAATAAQLVGIWDWDGTNAYLVDEIVVTLVTPNTTTTASFYTFTAYDDFVLPAGHALYVSTTVTTTASTTALGITAHGATL